MLLKIKDISIYYKNRKSIQYCQKKKIYFFLKKPLHLNAQKYFCEKYGGLYNNN